MATRWPLVPPNISNTSVTTTAPINHSATPRVTLKDNQAFANSRDVAEFFGKRHADVMRTVHETLAATDADVRWFPTTSYIDAKGERRGAYNMTKDGFTLLVMGALLRQLTKLLIVVLKRITACKFRIGICINDDANFIS